MRTLQQYPRGTETPISLHVPDLSQVSLPMGELTWRENDLLVAASLGATVVEASQLFSVSVPHVEQMRDAITRKFTAKNMAQAVHHAIQAEYLLVEAAQSRRTTTRLAIVELGVMAGIANGMSNRDIGLVISKSKNGVDSINRKIFEKINANGRTNTVRRAYQLGIFTVHSA